MLFGTLTKEFDHLQYLPVIQRMYDTNSVEEMKDYAGFSQVERYRKELETLRDFGLHKHLDIKVVRSQGEPTYARKFSDGKVDTILSVSNAKINETYRDNQNKKHYRRKIKNAFIESMVIKSNKTLSYDAQNPPHCLNCGAPIEPEGENYHCPYCDSLYKAEAYKYLITRFFIDKVFHDLHFLWFIFLPAIVVALLQVNGIIDEKQFETITLSYSFILAIPFTVLFFFALFKGLRDFIRHRSVPRNIRHHDPNFSQEIFTMRLNDLLAMHPEILLADEADNKKPQGIICRNLLQMYFCSYERHDGLEIVECTGMADALYLRGGSKRVRLQDKHKKFKVRLARAYGTLTPVHYQPDQFTCLNCGSHQMTEHEGTQVCSYCHTERPMETIDWVLC